MRRKYVVFYAVLFCIFMTGCNRAAVVAEEEPELIKPVAVNESYFPVDYSDFGKTFMEMATVVPTDYPQCFDTNVVIREICVRPGDRVKKGDVIAYADMTEKKEKLSEYKALLDKENDMYSFNAGISLELMEQRKLRGGEGVNTELALMQEDMNYERLLHEGRVRDYQKEIDIITEEIEKNALTANVNGYVSYVKSLADRRDAAATENIVVITDVDKKMLELEITTIDYGKYRELENQFIIRDGERVDVSEIAYSTDEQILAKINNKKLPVRLSCDGIENMEIGNSYYVHYHDSSKSDKLVVYANSVYLDESTYVYVKNEAGEGEKRYVEIGETDGWFTEILSGLTEGELVAFSSESLVPSEFGVKRIEYENISVTNHNRTFIKADSGIYTYYSEYEGRITDINPKLSRDSVLEEGEYLYTVDMSVGEADVQALRNLISRAQEDFDEAIAAYEKQKEENNKLIAQGIDREYLGHENNIIMFREKILAMNAREELDRLNNQLAGMLGGEELPGVVKIYAGHSGTVTDVNINNSSYIGEGEDIYTLEYSEGDTLKVIMEGITGQNPSYQDLDKSADLFETVNIEFGKKKYTGHCLGYYADNRRNSNTYFREDEKGTHISFIEGDFTDKTGFLVKMDDDLSEIWYELKNGMVTFSALRLEGAIVIPEGYVRGETNSIGQQVNYVWIKKNGYAFKQRVTVDLSMIGEIGGVLVLSGLNEGDEIIF